MPDSDLKQIEVHMDLEVAQEEVDRPVGGRLQFFQKNWEKISQDEWILETMSGCRVEFMSPPHQGREPAFIQQDEEKSRALDAELEKLIAKEAIEPVYTPSQATFISPMFVVPKSDGSWRPVLNLKSLNQYVRARHFKMESIQTAKGLLRRGDWMVKLDLKDAYLSIPMHVTHRQFLAFRWRGRLWRFKTLPFGLNSAPYIFTKLMKPVTAILRRLGIRAILYLDDLLIMAQSKKETKRHLATALELIIALGFIINTKKSVTDPAQEIEFLGFVLNSVDMIISLPQRKLKSLRSLAKRLRDQGSGTARQIAQLLGMMVAAHPAILPAPLHYRSLERAKSRTVRTGHSYESLIQVDHVMAMELQWWIDSASHHNGRPLQITQWDLTIETDASTMGWGAFSQEVRTGGAWTLEERLHHINYLELLAVSLALKTFASKVREVNILLRVDNVTAIAFLNRLGGTHSQELSDLAVSIWNWCLQREITIHAEHLPGRENVRADWESRHVKDSSDWMLRRDLFTQLVDRLGPFSIDLFASRTNTQVETYCSWRPDPAALAVDALSIPWSDHQAYMFPPFALITRCLEKLRLEQASAVLIAPVWQNQLWYPLLLQSLADFPILLPPCQDIILGQDGQNHPMAVQGHLPLAAWPISGNPSMLADFRMELLTSSRSPGEPQQNQHTPLHGGSGSAGVSHGVLIPFQPL